MASARPPAIHLHVLRVRSVSMSTGREERASLERVEGIQEYWVGCDETFAENGTTSDRNDRELTTGTAEQRRTSLPARADLTVSTGC